MSGRPGSAARVLLVLAVTLAAAVTACTGQDDRPDARITVSPRAALADEPVRIAVRGLDPGSRVTVRATASDALGQRWHSTATFRADGSGVASLASAPVAGSYRGAHPMGLLSFMTTSARRVPVFVPPKTGRYDVALRASVDGAVVARGRVVRVTAAAAGVTARTFRVATDGIHGSAFLPRDTTTRHAAVLLFGGSEGGLGPFLELQAAALAAHGYPALAVAYFKAPGLPATLSRIPLEYFVRALRTLRAEPGVDPGKVVVYSASRGTEAAMLLGAEFPGLVHGVVAVAPGSYVNSSLPADGHGPWTLHGRELPHAGADQFRHLVDGVDPRAVLPVERVRGPVLLSCGGQDLLWPSCRFTDDITHRLTARGFRYPVVALHFPQAGHVAGDLPPYAGFTDRILLDGSLALGGTVAGTEAASIGFTRRLLALLGSA